MTIIGRIDPILKKISVLNNFFEMTQVFNESLTCINENTIDELLSFEESLGGEFLFQTLFDNNQFFMEDMTTIGIGEFGSISAKNFIETESNLELTENIDDTSNLDDTYSFNDTSEFHTFFEYLGGLDVTMTDISKIQIDPSNANIISFIKEGIS